MDLGAFNKHVFLTGAGFPRNWGGLLASEFFNHLIGHPSIQASNALRGLLLETTNFEQALEKARSQPLPPEQVASLEKAIVDVFLRHDRAIQNAHFSGQGADVNIYDVQSFINRFHEGRGTAYIFTLNQDLLLERKYYNGSLPTLPGIESHRDWFAPRSFDFTSEHLRSIDGTLCAPGSVHTPILVGKFNYIKLHGSFDWRSADGQRVLVVGGGKADAINSVPLLAWYHEVFRAVCLAGDIRMFVSGYGFGDDHINRVLADGIREAGLRLFIHNVQSAEAMKAHLKSSLDGSVIWSGLNGYASRPLIEIFPPSGNRTLERENVESFFST